MSESFFVVGAGAWGTALAIMLAESGHQVGLWSHEAPHREQMRRERVNNAFLPDKPFPDAITIEDNLSDVQGYEHNLIVVPSSAFGPVLQQLKPFLRPQQPLLWATKGLDHQSGQFLSETATAILGQDHPLAVLTGPSFAKEVAGKHPTAIILAASDATRGKQLQQLVHTPYFRTYLTDDIIGAQIGGAVKNILAIAVGIADGLQYGTNTQVLLMTRGLAEMTRLGLKLGARAETINGLSGLGDLILTCSDNQSRNRRFGHLLGQGQSVAQATKTVHQVVEGVETARLIYQLSQQQQVEMPITEQVFQVLHQGKSIQDAINALLSRSV